MDVLDLIDEIEDIVEAGSGVPFSSKVMVDKSEILEIVKEIRIKLPDEIKQAAWIKDERVRILEEAQNDADKLLEDTELRLKELVDNDEITKKANDMAEEIIKKAQMNAKEIRIGSREYSDNLLMDTQESLREIIDLIDENRKELRGPDQQ